jgi:hypothetical protein
VIAVPTRERWRAAALVVLGNVAIATQGLVVRMAVLPRIGARCRIAVPTIA